MSVGGSDNLDTAAELQQLLNDAATAKVQRAAAPETHPSFDGFSCIGCGEPIIKERLALGRIRCVLCQEIREKKERK